MPETRPSTRRVEAPGLGSGRDEADAHIHWRAVLCGELVLLMRSITAETKHRERRWPRSS